MIALILSLFAYGGRKDDMVLKLVQQNRIPEAQERCEKWEADQLPEDNLLRHACAEAYWKEAKKINTLENWKLYRERWAGAPIQKKAAIEEIELALSQYREQPSKLRSEEYFLQLVELAPGTQSANNAFMLAVDLDVGKTSSKNVLQEPYDPYLLEL